MISVAPVGIFGFGVVRVIQGRSDWSVMAVRLKRLFYKNKTAVGTGPEIFGRLAIFVFCAYGHGQIMSSRLFHTFDREKSVNCFIL